MYVAPSSRFRSIFHLCVIHRVVTEICSTYERGVAPLGTLCAHVAAPSLLPLPFRRPPDRRSIYLSYPDAKSLARAPDPPRRPLWSFGIRTQRLTLLSLSTPDS